MLQANEDLVRITEVHLDGSSGWVGQTIADLVQRQGLPVMAIKRNGQYQYTPEAKTVLESGDILVMMGELEA